MKKQMYKFTNSFSFLKALRDVCSIMFLLSFLICSQFTSAQNPPPAFFKFYATPNNGITKYFIADSSQPSWTWSEYGPLSANGTIGASTLTTTWSTSDHPNNVGIMLIYVRGNFTEFSAQYNASAELYANNISYANIELFSPFLFLDINVAPGQTVRQSGAKTLVVFDRSYNSYVGPYSNDPHLIQYMGATYSMAGFLHIYPSVYYQGHGHGIGNIAETLQVKVSLIRVGQLPPQAIITPLSHPTMKVGEATTFDGSQSNDAANGGSIIEYKWTFAKPDNTSETLFGQTVNYTPSQSGVYSVTLTVTNNDGMTSTASVNATATGDSVHLGVTRLSQGNPLWQTHDYAGTNNTIGAKGCALTCLTMLLQFSGIQTLPDGTALNPGTLNDYFVAQNEGYDSSAGVDWLNGTTTASANSLNYYGTARINSNNNQQGTDDYLQEQLNQGHPVIVKVDNHHFVVVTGYDVQPDGTHFTVNDPGNSSVTSLDEYSLYELRGIVR